MGKSKFYQIKNVTEHGYTLVDCDGGVITRSIQDVDKSASVFTIKDAKDGDVLACYSDIKGQPIEQTGIIKQYIGRHGGCSNSFKAHFGVDWDNNVVIEGYMGSSNIYPATKEQRDTLFAKMKEAGYEWDGENKELKKIEQKPIDKPKFKVKYAGSEYNVFKTKVIAGVAFYGIEDEPNHIDYIKADNCEIISVYGIKDSY